MNGIIEGFVVIGSVIAVGYLVERAGLLGPTAIQVLSRTAFFIATPALLFTTLARADIGAVFSTNLLVTAVTSTVTCLLYVPVGLALRRPSAETAIGSMASAYVNASNLGLPIATYALGSTSAVAPALLFQLAVLTPIFTTVLGVLSEDAEGARPPLLRTLTAPVRNPLAVATGVGLIVSALRVVPPEPVMAPVTLVGNLALPGMLLAFGMSLHGATRPGTGRNAPVLAAVVLLKNLVNPLLALLLGLVLGLRGHGLLVGVVCAALPTGQNVFTYAVRFGKGVVLSRDAALVTTALSVPVLIATVLLIT